MGNKKNLIGAALLAVGIFISWAWTLPNYQASSVLKDMLAAKEFEYIEKGEIVDKIKNLAEQYKEKEEQIKIFQKIIPDKKYVDEAIIALEKITSETGFQFIEVKISEPAGNPSLGYQTLALEMLIEGQYESFALLLGQIEQNLRLIDVLSMDVSRSNVRPGIMSMTIRMNAYVAKEAPRNTQTGTITGEE